LCLTHKQKKKQNKTNTKKKTNRNWVLPAKIHFSDIVSLAVLKQFMYEQSNESLTQFDPLENYHDTALVLICNRQGARL